MLVPAPLTPVVMRTKFGSLDVVAAKWVLGLIPSEALPQIAVDALEAGFDTPSLRRLAGEMHPVLAETGPLFEEVLEELRTAIPDKSRAALVIAKAYATQIVDGTLSPYDGACEIWRIELAVEGLMLELGPFVYWASEWQDADSPGRRRECEVAIRTAALEFVGTS